MRKISDLFRFTTLNVSLLATVIAFCGLLLASIGLEARRQRRVVSGIEAIGGEVSLELNESKLPDFLDTSYLGRVRVVNVPGTAISDISWLSEMPNLIGLSVSNTAVSDLSPLVDTPKIYELFISGTRVFDIKPLAKLKRMDRLGMSNTRVTDISPLIECDSLVFLDLAYSDVQDVSCLSGLKRLQELDLTGTQVSRNQVEALAKEMPNCVFFVDWADEDDRTGEQARLERNYTIAQVPIEQ